MTVQDSYGPVYGVSYGESSGDADIAQTLYTPANGDVALSLTIYTSPETVVTETDLVDGQYVFSYPRPVRGAYPYRFLVRRADGTTYFDRGPNDEGEIVFPQRSPMLVGLRQMKRELGWREQKDVKDDDALLGLMEAATRVIQELAGPVLPVVVTETLEPGQRLLSQAPVISLTSVSTGSSTVAGTVDLEAGLLTSPCYGQRTVTYTAGRAVIPPNVTLATVELISHWWRQRRGGSQTYVPGGEQGFVPGNPSTWGVPNRVKDILGPDLRAPRVG